MSATPPAPTAAKPTGLEGMVAGQTQIASVADDRLVYRGYDAAELAKHATFEAVAFLLIEGHKPSDAELDAFNAQLVEERPLPPAVSDLADAAGGMINRGVSTPMDALRTAVSLMGELDEDSPSNEPDAERRKAVRVIARIPQVLGRVQAAIDGADPVPPDDELSHAAYLYRQITRRTPTDAIAAVLDSSLILYAEHDFNASTFTARIIASTLGDTHGALAGAIAALKGPLHGGANEAALDMLREIGAHVDGGGTVDRWLDDAFAAKRKLMGFGHRVYKDGDHRAPILHALGRELAEAQGPDAVRLFELGEAVQKGVLDRKGLHPNVDFPCGMTYAVMGIPVPMYTPIFAAARAAGWCAHIIEQHANNRLIRPLAEYTGPTGLSWA